MDIDTLRREVRPPLEAAFGSRLRGIVLFGSRARGDASADSDIDLLVLLDDPLSVGRDIDTIVEALYPLQLEIDAAIHALPARAETYERGTFALYRNAQAEGIRL
ncbi:MAG TPA: nucleotidyltransferase domain-containing protein [Thermoanaerobaculia bacterium]|nr:nucleotidyltransferase domain-containing protein [Thermoanaerobaculia bacterium]